MSNPYYPAQLTPCTREQLLYALKAAWRLETSHEAEQTPIRFLLAHILKETGGRLMYCYNVGNIKAGGGWRGGVTWFQASEVLNRGPKGKGGHYWADFSPTYVPGEGWINRFRAYPTLQAGVDDYVRTLFATRGFQRAVMVLHSINHPAVDDMGYYREAGDRYVLALREGSYFTASPEGYLSSYGKLVKEVWSLPFPSAAPQAAPTLTPRGFDPVQTSHPAEDIALVHPVTPDQRFRTTPPVGPAPTSGHCGSCKGVYAVHLGYQPGDPVLPPILEGIDADQALSGPPPAPALPVQAPPKSIYGQTSTEASSGDTPPKELPVGPHPSQPLQLQVESSGGAPVPGAKVVVRTPDGRELTLQSDGSGQVSAVLPEGSVTVSVDLPPEDPSPNLRYPGAASRVRAMRTQELLERMKNTPRLSSAEVRAWAASRHKPKAR